MFRKTLCLALALGWGGLARAGSSPVLTYLHTNPLTNNTGQTANDLHVNVTNVDTSDTSFTPTADPLQFKSIGSSGTQINFDSGNVADGQHVLVNWKGTALTDGISGGNWSKDGTDIGDFNHALITLDIQASATRPGLGNVFIVNNSDTPVSYSGVELLSHVPLEAFSTSAYLTALEQGEGIPDQGLGIKPQGVLPPGETLLAEISSDGNFIPIAAPGALTAAEPAAAPLPFFDGGFIDVGGQIYALAAANTPQVTAAPEPATVSLLASAIFSLAAAACWKGWMHLRHRPVAAL